MIIAIGLYRGFTALDAIGPYEVLTYLHDAQVVICAEHTGVVDDQYDLLHLRVDTTFADVPRPDVLLVPGVYASSMSARNPAITFAPGPGQYCRADTPRYVWRNS